MAIEVNSNHQILKALRSDVWRLGDELVCTDECPSGYISSLIKGNTYIFDGYPDSRHNLIYIAGKTSAYPAYCFKLKQTKETKKPMCNYHNYRDKQGRFAPLTNPHFGITVKPVAQSFVGDVPKVLRNGALYHIVGVGIGRLKGTVKDIAVISMHGKLTAVKSDRLRLAPKEDVDQYLADAVEAKA